MDPLEPIAPRPQLPSIDRAAPTRRVQREQEQAHDQDQERRRRRHRDDEPEPDGADTPDDGHPHVDISV